MKWKLQTKMPELQGKYTKENPLKKYIYEIKTKTKYKKRWQHFFFFGINETKLIDVSQLLYLFPYRTYGSQSYTTNTKVSCIIYTIFKSQRILAQVEEKDVSSRSIKNKKKYFI